MARYTAIIFVICLALIISANTQGCGGKNTKDKAIIQNSDSSKSPGKVVFEFLKWYKNNYRKIIANEMVNNLPNTKCYDSTKYYSVNFAATEKYLNYMKSSGYISDKYLNYWREYFKKCEVKFKQNPMNDMPPDGFDYDFVYLSQEISDYNLDNVEINKEIRANNSANVIVTIDKAFTYEYKLTFDGTNWLIDSLGYHDSNLNKIQ